MNNPTVNADDFDYKKAFIEQESKVRQLEERLHELEAKLYHSEKLASIGYLAAGVHHELTNPLSVSTANLQLIENHVNELIQFDTLAWQIIAYNAVSDDYLIQHQRMDENNATQELKELLVETNQGLKQVADINNSLKTLSTSSYDDVPLSDINQCITSALNAVKNELKYTISMHQDLDSSLPLVPFHFGQIQQVLVNLLLNAKQANKENTNNDHNIWVQSHKITHNGTQYIEVSVSDDGMGISEDIQDKIFDPFFTTKTNAQGTGLGLAISNDIVQRHNGTLALNINNQKNTEFLLRLQYNRPLNAE